MGYPTEKLIKLITAEVQSNVLPADFSVTDSELAEMYSVTCTHSVSHLLASSLINNNLLSASPLVGVFRESIYSTLYGYEKRSYALERVCEALENAGIAYIPLKGSVIKDFYPEPWMRTGCDIDILVHEEELRKAADALTSSLGYKEEGKGKHDIQILSTENVYIELHFSLLEEEASPKIARVLERVWDYASPVENGKFRYKLDDAMFYFYHIAHMAKHFIRGGCGMRPFLDLWVMRGRINRESKETEHLLKKGGLSAFAETAEELCDVWFSGVEHSRVTRVMEEFILEGGCFGTHETKILTEQQKAGGKAKHIFSRIFIPYNELKRQYPIIKKYKFLTPFCEICRLLSLLFGKKKNFRKNYFGKLSGVSDERIEDINLLFESVGF